MRFRLLRRKLTVSAPRMAVRSALPWPFRWLLGAVVLGFSGSLAMWAFEFGRDIAGLDRESKQELSRLRNDVQTLRADLLVAQSVANTSESLLTTERSAQEQLAMRIRQLEADNEALRSDLGFFERLIPGADSGDLSIRGLQAEPVSGTQWRWQALMMQATKNAPDFKGGLEITFAGTLDGKPWSMAHSPKPQSVLIKGYLRLEGIVEVPPSAMVKNVTARVMQGGSVRSVQTFQL